MSSSLSLHTFIVLCSLLMGNYSAHARTENQPESALGESVYRSVSEAVFLVEVIDDAGNVSSVGSAFLVGNQLLATNYHVVQGGRPHLRVGSIRLECTIQKTDPGNDLALLHVQASIAARPLALSLTEPPPGATIFTIGNPAGLERTISQGLVSGSRNIEGKPLIQISASISPGSSGGPVVNAQGEVVGVTVGYLESGQNLNFAVPSRAVGALLQAEGGSPSDIEALLQQATSLSEERRKFALSEFEEWRQLSEKIESLLVRAKELAGNSPERLLQVGEAADQVYIEDIAIESTRAILAISSKPDLRVHRILARNLERGSWLLEEREKRERLTEALDHAKIVVARSSKPSADDLFLLAWLIENNGQTQESHATFQRALAAARTERLDDIRPYLRGLFRTSKTSSDADSWLKQIIEHGGAEYFDWSNLAQRLDDEKQFQMAGDAWAKAAEINPTSEYFCQAGSSYWIANQLDKSLSFYRRCIAIATTEETSEHRLAQAYTAMSSIFYDRGVYDQSIAYAKQALALSPEAAWPHHYMSQSLNALGRNVEAASAAESAVRLTDGRFSEMHFALGSAYFDLQNWSRSSLAFQKAAELNPESTAAPYNVALCMQRQGFFSDSAKWYEEVLRRNPAHPEKEEILKRIRTLRE